MKHMINVNIDETLAKEMLWQELDKWNLGGIQRELIGDYLDSLVDGGSLHGGEFDPMQIVDNFYINGSFFAYEGDDDWKNLKIGTKEQDERVYKVKDGVALVGC